MAVPSVVGLLSSTQPTPFSANCSAECTATSAPVSALQYMRISSETRSNSTRDESASMMSSPLDDSRRKKASPPSGLTSRICRPASCQRGRSSGRSRRSTSGADLTNSIAAMPEVGTMPSASSSMSRWASRSISASDCAASMK
ncbi:MAG: hypothetical protein F4Y94_02495 [Chloroflexi bacterium]|nr:hypothetical protein [Chloroflexota bacterium]